MVRYCFACGGRYNTVNGDGSPYFHVCGLVYHRLVIRDGEKIDIGLAEPQPTDTTVQEFFAKRDGHRDENIVTKPDGTRGEREKGSGCLEAETDEALDALISAHRDQAAAEQAPATEDDEQPPATS